MNTNQENRKLDRVQLFQRPVDQIIDLFLEIFLPVADFGKELIEELLINALVSSIVLVLSDEFGGGVAGNLLLVQRLYH